ncbi:hypothetical protein WN51_09591 [Melipona quadrifasciata]|uniref:Uncharacterized protein n=2 Tax=Melipona TaxID=28651 RepID=A0A0N0U6Z9_9HYME|nr:hypothetical protein K0M31_013593 [Melipona bicolor]KOX78232.1 hypothetical protein WN51_09591 [Melipona quadrifasciata]
MSIDKQDYHRASNAVVLGGVITYIAGLLLVIAFTSPYWIESYQETFSNFKHMGLWEYCFKQFRYPYYQYDKEFDGCHHIFSKEYHVIREWLLPGWLMVVQTFVTLALLLSFFAQAVIVLTLVRWPLKFVLKFEWFLSAIAFLCCVIAGTLLFLAVSIFGGQCWRRDWLMYPNFNHLSWSYGLAVISFMFHWLASCLLYLDAKASYRLRKESRNLVMQMQPNLQSHQGLSIYNQRGGYI